MRVLVNKSKKILMNLYHRNLNQHHNKMKSFLIEIIKSVHSGKVIRLNNPNSSITKYNNNYKKANFHHN